MRKVAVIGLGMTKFGQLFDRDLVSLAVEAGAKAVRDAGVRQKDVEALYGGTMSGGLFINQEHLSSVLADKMGFRNIPSTRVEAACASGGLALRQGYIDVASGMHDIAVVGGVEKMTDIGTHSTTNVLATAADTEYEGAQGATFPGLYAMMAKLHMHRYKTTEEQMALVAVKNHKNALFNEHAQFQKQISVNDVLNSPVIADPLKLLDASPITDGAAALVLASEEKAHELCDTPVWIAGSGHATDTISLHDREDILTLKATVQAAKQAYLQSGLEPKDIGTVEVHDCFTIAELLALEDLGFVEKGKSGKFTEDGETEIGGKIPVNTSGGLKAKGHPIGASGISQAIEAVLQLRGDAGKRNTGAETAMTHNIGGTGGTAVVHIFKR
ncbi:thiolase domain-containing protein [Candidatus Woesearchaeota archaeon]|nr:thiolase domain-containing protein [Candidatus Woesearchaeota archaeon]